jgi:hypothetical protein
MDEVVCVELALRDTFCRSLTPDIFDPVLPEMFKVCETAADWLVLLTDSLTTSRMFFVKVSAVFTEKLIPRNGIVII